MLRINVPERPQWKTLAKELGFHFHTIDGEPYWKEDAYYQFTLEQVEQEAAASTQSSSGAAADAPPPSARARRFNVYVGEQFFEVDVDPVGVAASGQAAGAPVVAPSTPVAPAASAAPAAVDGETSLLAPMPGIIVKYSVEVGQQVAAGEPVVVLEAMKMQNVLPAPVGGTVKALGVSPGDQVVKDDVLATISS